MFTVQGKIHSKELNQVYVCNTSKEKHVWIHTQVRINEKDKNKNGLKNYGICIHWDQTLKSLAVFFFFFRIHVMGKENLGLLLWAERSLKSGEAS